MSGAAEHRLAEGRPLTDEERRDLFLLSYEVLRGSQRLTELTEGYVFEYPRQPVWNDRLALFRSYYRRTHPQFTTEVTEDPDRGLLSLRVEGPPGTKEYLSRTVAREVWNPRIWNRKLRRRLRRLTGPLRTLPDFLIIGAARCGTTSLFAYLLEHPCVAQPWKKEVFFFDRYSGSGTQWYRSHFPLALAKQYRRVFRGGKSLTGEATPSYLFHPHAPRRAHQTLPHAKLIVLLRDPVKRAYSHYQLKIRSGQEFLSFEEALDREEDRVHGNLDRMISDESYFSVEWEDYSYLARGVYAEQIENWLRFYRREQLLILKTEQFHRDRQATFRQVLQFLELPPWEPDRFPTYHAVPRSEMTAEARQRLMSYYRPHNQRLYQLLGEDLGWDSS